MRLVVLLAAFGFAAASTQAQGGLVATPNPFANDGTAPLAIRNPTAAPVALDSLRVASTQRGRPYRGSVGFSYRGTLEGVEVRGHVTCASFEAGACRRSGGLNRPFLPSDVLEFASFSIFCEVCRPSNGGVRPDTLRIYSGGSVIPLNVRIADVLFVATETPPEASALRLSLAPNPVRGASVLTLAHAQAGPVRVAALDTLGREVAVFHDGLAPETLALRIDTSAWPPGLYVVRATADAGTVSTRLVVVR